jgi:hypothetical protein
MHELDKDEARIAAAMARDIRDEIDSGYLTFAEREALRRIDDPDPRKRDVGGIGRTFAIAPDLAEELVQSAQRKRAAGAPIGTASRRRSRRMGRNLLRYRALLTRERARRIAAGL